MGNGYLGGKIYKTGDWKRKGEVRRKDLDESHILSGRMMVLRGNAGKKKKEDLGRRLEG